MQTMLTPLNSNKILGNYQGDHSNSGKISTKIKTSLRQPDVVIHPNPLPYMNNESCGHYFPEQINLRVQHCRWG